MKFHSFISLNIWSVMAVSSQWHFHQLFQSINQIVYKVSNNKFIDLKAIDCSRQFLAIYFYWTQNIIVSRKLLYATIFLWLYALEVYAIFRLCPFLYVPSSRKNLNNRFLTFQRFYALFFDRTLCSLCFLISAKKNTSVPQLYHSLQWT